MSEQESPYDPEAVGEPGSAESVNTAPDEEPEAGAQEPDEDAGPAVEPIVGDQGPEVQEQDATDALAAGDTANMAARQSAPAPERQSGVPTVPENAGVEPQPEFAGPVDRISDEEREKPLTERSPDAQTTHPAEPSE